MTTTVGVFVNIPGNNNKPLRCVVEWYPQILCNTKDHKFHANGPNRSTEMKHQLGYQEWNNVLTFAIVMNPFERLVNIWKKNCCTNNSFDDFVTNVVQGNISDALKKKTCLQLNHIIDPLNNNVIVHYIIRYETFEQQFNELKKQLDLPEHVSPLAHEDIKSVENYQKCYTNDKTKQLVTDFYKKDLNYFNYTF
jgi:hypothetical protein